MAHDKLELQREARQRAEAIREANDVPREVSIRQWFHTALTEREGQALVGHIQGTKKYSLLVPYNDLPEQAKAIVRAEYDRTVQL